MVMLEVTDMDLDILESEVPMMLSGTWQRQLTSTSLLAL